MPTSPVAVKPSEGTRARPSGPTCDCPPAASAIKEGKYGLAKLGWFNKLYASNRNSSFSLSVMAVFLKIEKSNCRKCGPNNEFRPSFPKCRVPGIQVSANPSPPPAGNVHGAVNDERSRKLRGSPE